MEKLTNEMNELQRMCGTHVIYEGVSCIKNITSRKMLDDSLIYSKLKNQKIKDGIKWQPMDEDWKSNCKSMFWFQDSLKKMKEMYPQMDERLFELREKLLSFGGESVCLPAYEEDLTNILKYGQLWIGNNIKFMKGRPSQCHANSCELWENNKDISRVCTGYALSEDGMWRAHSWLVWHKSRSNQIVETTVPRVLYFGFVMNEEMCEEFAYNNL